MTRRMVTVAIALAAVLSGAACGTKSTTTAASTSASNVATTSTTLEPNTNPKGTTTVSGPDPNAPEVVAPGDIPDNQAFVAYPAAGGFSVKVPEGWARSDISADHVSFSDKYNTVDITWKQTPAAPTEASIQTAIESAGFPGFSLTKVSTVQRSAGPAVLATYQRTSDPNAVTGKRVALEVEQYEFWKNGTNATLTLSGAKGADNVDPWKIVTDGFAWTK